MIRLREFCFGCWIVGTAWLTADCTAQASDWSRFRGPNGSGVSPDTTPLPSTWSPTQNLQWKAKLPGPGHSSAIVIGDKIFVTCWSGYGTERGGRGGDQKELKRHLVCLNRKTGDIIGDKSVAAVLPEDSYGGMFAEHGYATHTPVSDGERIYVFFGKSGALAFDMAGNQLWQTPLGTGLDQMGWGSASSPILFNNLLIVTAAPESQAMYALDTKTGKEVWKAPAEGFASTWGTPVLVQTDGRTDIVLGVPYEIWGFNPETGKLRWFCEAAGGRSFCSSVVTDNSLIYAMGDEGSNTAAIKAGGNDDVTKSHVAWTGRDRSRISSPVLVDGKLYFVSNRVATCLNAKNGSRIFQGRLAGGGAADSEESETPRQPRGGFGGFGGGGFGGRGGGQDYSSPVAADGKLFFVTRSGDVHVVKLGDKFELLATNRVTADPEDFSATPAISDGQLFIRSSKHLYCVANAAAK